MKRLLLFGIALALLGTLSGGCGITGATLVVEPRPRPVVVVESPPPRVYYHGQWLHYRSNGYYYYHGGTWVSARAVPTHVAHYHRPVVHHRTYRRPTTVHRRSTTHRQTTTRRTTTRRYHKMGTVDDVTKDLPS